MTWENGLRERRRARRRQQAHEQRIADAPTSKKRLSAACQWLISEAWLAGTVDDALQHVLTYVHELRKGAGHDRADDAA